MRRTTWLLAALLPAVLLAGCAAPAIDGGGPRGLVPDCQRTGTVMFPQQRCQIVLEWDGTSEFRIPAHLKTIYLRDPSPALVIWRLPPNARGHVFVRDSLKLGRGNGYFSDANTGDEGDESVRGPARSKVYRVLVTQVVDLCREYTLSVERTDPPMPAYEVDPTIANGNSLVYEASKTVKLCP